MHPGGEPSDGNSDTGLPTWLVAAVTAAILLPILGGANGFVGLVVGVMALIVCELVRTLRRSKELAIRQPDDEPQDGDRKRKRGLVKLRLPPPPKPTPFLERSVPAWFLAVLIGSLAPLLLLSMKISGRTPGTPSHLSGTIATSGTGATAATTDAARGGFGSTASRLIRRAIASLALMSWAVAWDRPVRPALIHQRAVLMAWPFL
jgi:hypothetical protein